VIASLTKVEVRSPGGVYLGTAGGSVVKLGRLNRVVERITKGLFYQEFGYPLPQDVSVCSCHYSGHAGGAPQVPDHLLGYCATLLSQPGKTIGRDVFTYWYGCAEGEPNATVWLMRFYQRVDFISVTAPTAAVETVGKGIDLTPPPS
jgi:hypothetical protein